MKLGNSHSKSKTKIISELMPRAVEAGRSTRTLVALLGEEGQLPRSANWNLSSIYRDMVLPSLGQMIFPTAASQVKDMVLFSGMISFLFDVLKEEYDRFLLFITPLHLSVFPLENLLKVP